MLNTNHTSHPSESYRRRNAAKEPSPTEIIAIICLWILPLGICPASKSDQKCQLTAFRRENHFPVICLRFCLLSAIVEDYSTSALNSFLSQRSLADRRCRSEVRHSVWRSCKVMIFGRGGNSKHFPVCFPIILWIGRLHLTSLAPVSNSRPEKGAAGGFRASPQVFLVLSKQLGKFLLQNFSGSSSIQRKNSHNHLHKTWISSKESFVAKAQSESYKWSRIKSDM